VFAEIFCEAFLSLKIYFAKHPGLISVLKNILKGIVSPDWKGLQMVSLDRFEV
jgi:hypothetical protein